MGSTHWRDPRRARRVLLIPAAHPRIPPSHPRIGVSTAAPIRSRFAVCPYPESSIAARHTFALGPKGRLDLLSVRRGEVIPRAD